MTMNIKEAKEQIKNAMTAYFTKDEFGSYAVPVEKQRPVFLMGPPGIGKTAIMEQIAQEGAIQIFKFPGSGYEDIVIGVVGSLQFDVFEYRMRSEYGVELRMDMLPYEEIRLIDEYPGDLSDLNLGSDAELLEDYRGRSLLVFSSFWAIDFTCRRNPGLKVSEIVVAEG